MVPASAVFDDFIDICFYSSFHTHLLRASAMKPLFFKEGSAFCRSD